MVPRNMILRELDPDLFINLDLSTQTIHLRPVVVDLEHTPRFS